MTTLRLGVHVILLAGFALAASVQARPPKSIALPTADEPQFVPSDLPGYSKARASCMTCHSADYILYQPNTAARPYWEAMVKRMKVVFNAPIDDADMPDIVDYLSRTYGAGRER